MTRISEGGSSMLQDMRDWKEELRGNQCHSEVMRSARIYL